MSRLIRSSSAALPKVALSSPPIPGPVWCARCSVASPMRPARGRIATHETTKMAVGEAWLAPSQRLAGTKTRSVYRILLPFIMVFLGGGRAAGSRWAP